MSRSNCCCIWFSNTDPTKDRDFICYHYAVAGAMCAISWVCAALVAYRYTWIIKVFHIIFYVVLPGPSSYLIVFLWYSLGVCHRCIPFMANVWLLSLESRMSGVIASLPSVIFAWEWSTCACFSIIQPPIRNWPRRRSRQVLSFRASTMFFLYNDSLVVR